MNDQPTPDTPQRFQRSLSGFGVIILTLSVLSPGVSIFVSGASIIHQAGTGAVLAFVIGSFVCYCQTSLSAELGAAYPSAGYDQAALGHAIGDWAGATSLTASLCAIPLFLNISAGGIAVYLHPFGLPFGDDTVTFGLIALITALSLLNIRSNEGITGLFMLIEVGALLLVAVVGAWHVRPDAVRLIVHPVRVDNGAFAIAAIGVVGIAVNNAAWSLAGASQALYFSEDMKRPETIGRIIMLAFVIAVVLEIAPVIGAIVGAHDLRAVLATENPFEVFLAQYLPGFVLKLVSAAIAIAIFNACLAGFVGIGRNLFAMGRTRLFAAPVNRALMRLTRRSEAPWVAILLIAATTALATYLPLSFKILLLSGNTTVLIAFQIIGVWIGRRSGRTGSGRTGGTAKGAGGYRTPLFPLIPAVGVIIFLGEVVVLWLDADAGRKSLFVCVAVWLLSFLYYRLVLMRRPEGWSLRGPEDIDRQVGAGEP